MPGILRIPLVASDRNPGDTSLSEKGNFLEKLRSKLVSGRDGSNVQSLLFSSVSQLSLPSVGIVWKQDAFTRWPR